MKIQFPQLHSFKRVGTESKATSKTDIVDTLGENFVTIHHHSITLNPSERLKQNKRKLN